MNQAEIIKKRHKKDERLADSYQVTLKTLVGDSISYDVVEHAYVAHMRFIELTLTNRERVVIPLEVGTLTFSKELDQIIEIKQELKAKEGRRKINNV